MCKFFVEFVFIFRYISSNVDAVFAGAFDERPVEPLQPYIPMPKDTEGRVVTLSDHGRLDLLVTQCAKFFQYVLYSNCIKAYTFS